MALAMERKRILGNIKAGINSRWVVLTHTCKCEPRRLHTAPLNQRFEFRAMDEHAAGSGTPPVQQTEARACRSHVHHRRVGCIPRGGIAFTQPYNDRERRTLR